MSSFTFNHRLFNKNTLRLRSSPQSDIINDQPTSSSYIYNDIIFYQDHQDDPKINLGKKPLLYCPGVDGSGNYSSLSLQNLTKDYNVWRLLIRPSDRSRFIDLATICSKFINEAFDEPPVLVGER
jgi:hypothetical protein